MKRGRLLAAGIGVYVIVLVATAPATLIDAGLQDAGDGRLRLVEAHGTLWSGRGQLEIRDAHGRSGLALDLAWRLRPRSLLLARLDYEVELDSGSAPIPVTIYPSRIELANADVNMPAAALGYLIPKLASMGLAGELNIRLSSLSIGRSVTRGNATIEWHKAASALSPVSPLGDYQLRIEAMGPEVHVTLHTLHGPLQLDGQGLWPSDHPPVFLAIAHMPTQLQPQLAPFLRLVAVERDDGSFEWQLK